MEQLLVLNREGELKNHDTDKFVIIDSNKVISSYEATTKWELGTFSNKSRLGYLENSNISAIEL